MGPTPIGYPWGEALSRGEPKRLSTANPRPATMPGCRVFSSLLRIGTLTPIWEMFITVIAGRSLTKCSRAPWSGEHFALLPPGRKGDGTNPDPGDRTGAFPLLRRSAGRRP